MKRTTRDRPLPGYLLGLLLSVFLLGACANLQLVEDYDPQIEQSLNSYHTSFVTFVTQMEQGAGKPEGSYSSETAQDFYAQSAGLLSNLLVRAEANNPGATCHPSSAVASGLNALLNTTAESVPDTSGTGTAIDTLGGEIRTAVQEFNEGTSELSIGSCTVVVLKTLKLNHEIFESIHKRKTYLQPPASTIGMALIADGVKMAIIVEQSKKP